MNCATGNWVNRISFLLLFPFAAANVQAQEADTISNPLSAVEVKAYGQTRKLKEVPAAVGFVGPKTLERFSPASVVQAVNTVAGVRMEERSPGSYRFNIRGSSLRSPFGVRNVKVYFNDIPYTDPGGNTYLNSLGYYNFGSIEILKGPGSSLYGAGTGGVLLIESLAAGQAANVTGEYTVGSYGLHNAYGAVTTGDAESKSRLGYQHQASDGYRFHSEMKRDVLSWVGSYRFNDKQVLKTTFLYSDLFYETPGALTRAEYNAKPKAFRPAAGSFPSAEKAAASIAEKTFLAGASFIQRFAQDFSNQSTAYGMFTELRNPAIRNYGKATEPHVGGRTVFTYKKQLAGTLVNVSLGGELQQNFSTSTTFKNAGGQPDSLQSLDDIYIRQSFVFLQASVALRGWEVTAGGSLNGSQLSFRRSAPTIIAEQRRTLNDQFTPRLAIAKKLENVMIYSSISRGFSPPTSGELLPSGSAINLALQAEEGTNYDVGLRGILGKNLAFDFNAFYFRLSNAIVQRRDAGGGDYFINAGKTAQKGLESSLSYAFFNSRSVLRSGLLWASHSYHYFRYKEFKQLAADYSGNALPGTAPNTVSAGLDVAAKNGLLATVTYYFTSRIPLNDANTDYADAYHLVGAKLGFRTAVKNKAVVKFMLGAENLLNEKYSLGNDINAFGGRYFNAAAGRNYYASLIFQLSTAKEKAPQR